MICFVEHVPMMVAVVVKAVEGRLHKGQRVDQGPENGDGPVENILGMITMSPGGPGPTWYP